jgi:hypothetical protein
MKSIPLSRGLVTLVDDEDLDWLCAFRWHASCNKQYSYAVRNLRLGESGTTFMHRMILDVPVGLWVDHADRNGLNNQRLNLRIATRSTNAANSKPRPHSSRFKGVGWHGLIGLWRARIQVDGNSRYLGAFDREIDAALAYDIAARETFGPFANLNFPNGVVR